MLARLHQWTQGVAAYHPGLCKGERNAGERRVVAECWRRRHKAEEQVWEGERLQRASHGCTRIWEPGGATIGVICKHRILAETYWSLQGTAHQGREDPVGWEKAVILLRGLTSRT